MKNDLLKRIESMTMCELYEEIYRDHLTGCLNRRAFDDDERKYVCIVDLDSLKYLNDNISHRAGDGMLCSLSKALINNFGKDNVYRLSGDEFAVKSLKPVGVHRVMEQVREQFPVFCYGFGVNVTFADQALKADKHQRLILGLRAERGERPPWFDRIDSFIKDDGSSKLKEIKIIQDKLAVLCKRNLENERITGFGNLSIDYEIKETEKDLEFLLKQREESL